KSSCLNSARVRFVARMAATLLWSTTMMRSALSSAATVRAPNACSQSTIVCANVARQAVSTRATASA
ncbi:MAG: hypothetical protein ACK559_12890, partial [bacterium]